MTTGHQDRFPPWALALPTFVGSALIALPSFPGRMNADALDLYGQALGDPLHDWHAPLVAWLWRMIGASPALVAEHTTLIVFAIVYAVVLTLRANGLSSRAALLAAFGFAAFPPVLNHLAAVSKDTWVAALFVATFAMSSSAAPARFVHARAALIALAPSIRPETVLLLPLFIWGEYVLAGRKLLPAARFAGVLLVIAAALGLFVAKVVKPEARHAEGGIFLFDLAGISIRTGQLLLTPASFPANDLAVLQRHYWSDSLSPIAWATPESEMVRFVVGDDLAELRRRWVSAVVTHPLAYLDTRSVIVRRYLRGHWTYHPGIDSNPRIHLFWPKLNGMVNAYLGAAPQWLSSHWLPMIGAVVLLAVVVRLKLHRRRPEWLVYLVVAIAYQLMLLPLIVVPDYRFGYASVILFFLILGLTARDLALMERARTVGDTDWTEGESVAGGPAAPVSTAAGLPGQKPIDRALHR